MELINQIHHFLQSAPHNQDVANMIFAINMSICPIMMFIINPLIKKSSEKLCWLYVFLIIISLIMSLIYERYHQGFFTFGLNILTSFMFIGGAGLGWILGLKAKELKELNMEKK